MRIFGQFLFALFFLLCVPAAASASGSRDVISVEEWDIAEGNFSYREASSPPVNAVWTRAESAVMENTFGVGRTIWLRIKIPSSAGSDFSVHLRNVDQCFTMYLDGVQLYQAGSVAHQLSPFDWHLIVLPSGSGGKYLYLNIYSSISSIGVISNTAWFGSSDKIIYRIFYEDIDKLVVGILFIILGFSSLGMIWTGINRRAFASFGMFVMTLGVYTVTQGRIKQIIFGHNAELWGIAELLSLYMVPFGVTILINQIVNPSRKNPFRYLWVSSGSIAAAALLMAVVWPNGLMNFIYPFQIYLFIVIIVAVGMISYAAFRGNLEARIFGIGMLFLVVFASYDLLQNMYVMEHSRYVSHWGLLIFTLCIAGILIRRIIGVYRDAENTARKLEYKNIILNQTYLEMEGLHKEIELTQKEVIFRLSEVAEARSRETGNHVRRVAEYCRLLAIGSGMSYDQVDILKLAAPMHDIGKLAIPDAILNKPDKLTAEEFEQIKGHTLFGFEMLRKSEREIFRAAAIVAWEHHEKFAGGGYPRGIAGEEIHIFGRITAVADVFDSLASDRCYKKAWEIDRVLSLMKDERGRHFDPVMIDVLFDNLPGFLEVRDNFKDQ